MARAFTRRRRSIEFVVCLDWIVSSDLQKCLRDRERRAQFVGRIGREPLLFRHMCFELGQHGVEGICQLAELVVTAGQADPMRQ